VDGINTDQVLSAPRHGSLVEVASSSVADQLLPELISSGSVAIMVSATGANQNHRSEQLARAATQVRALLYQVMPEATQASDIAVPDDYSIPIDEARVAHVEAVSRIGTVRFQSRVAHVPKVVRVAKVLERSRVATVKFASRKLVL
jgi:Skp family chaperone for outer membrane proteins